jgi:hypothetical protein
VSGSEDQPKLRSLEWNKRDVAPRTRAAAVTATTDFLTPNILNTCGRAVPAPDRPIGSTLADIAIGLGRDHPLQFQGQRPKMLCKQRIQLSLCLVCREALISAHSAASAWSFSQCAIISFIRSSPWTVGRQPQSVKTARPRCGLLDDCRGALFCEPIIWFCRRAPAPDCPTVSVLI